MNGFDDPEAVARYAENPPRLVPGFHDLHRMARVLLSETVPTDGTVLIVGAGGGLEIKAFAEAHPNWRFVGVDPNSEMLKLAKSTLAKSAQGNLNNRVDLHQGYIDIAPDGPFDGACCLLTLHFVPVQERISTLREIRRRLKTGAIFVVAHHSLPAGPEREIWLDRFAAYAATNGVHLNNSDGGARKIGEILPIISPESEVEILKAAGFQNPKLFYTAFTFKGWVAHA